MQIAMTGGSFPLLSSVSHLTNLDHFEKFSTSDSRQLQKAILVVSCLGPRKDGHLHLAKLIRDLLVN